MNASLFTFHTHSLVMDSLAPKIALSVLGWAPFMLVMLTATVVATAG